MKITKQATPEMIVSPSTKLWWRFALCMLFLLVNLQYGMAQETQAETEPAAVAPTKTPEQKKPVDGVMPIDRAWEYSHYRVRVWICTDGTPETNGLRGHVREELVAKAETVDRSAWELLVNDAPNPWNWRFSNDLINATKYPGIEKLQELEFDDKLMIVSLKRSATGVRCEVREFDLLAQQWGSLLARNLVQIEDIGQSVFELVTTAFMPVAQVESADENNAAVLRARAVLSCIVSRLDENGEWVAETNLVSPVYIRDHDVFLPVLRRTDRDGKLASLDPVPYTFVTLDSVDGARIDGHVQSTVRAPLSGRRSKRLQKLALVIRPPNTSTVLKLFSKDEKGMVMEGIEIYSRPPNADKDASSEYLGKTDWRGLITIPPSEDGLRMIYLKRGARALRKLPIVPGFIPFLETDIANDEARLYAEGVIEGINIELIDLVTQRQVYEDDINKALDAADYNRARDILTKYNELPRASQIRARLSDEEARLRTRAKDKKEIEFINNMFSSLQTILSTYVGESKESEIRKKIDRSQPASADAPKSDVPTTE
ncbi:MAG: hypothetical protein ABL888_20080, partial [Pirellulaceae bacterium]